MEKVLYLIDGSGYIFRAYYAISPLSTKDGFPTNALYGFTRMLLKTLREKGAQYLAVAFDSGRETFRREIFTEYKANRAECPDDLNAQIPYFRQIVEALGITTFEAPGYEADDVIGSIIAVHKECVDKIVIVSGDKDLMQLVSDKIIVWDSMKDRVYDREKVKEKFGVYPEQLRDYLALVGDSSDNIPGLKGVGAKTAAQLLNKWKDINTLVNSLTEIENDKSIRGRAKIVEQLRTNLKALNLSKKLVTIRDDISDYITVDGELKEKISSWSCEKFLKSVELKDKDREKLKELFEQFEFSSLLKEFNLNAPSVIKSSSSFTVKIAHKKNFKDFLQEILKQKEFAFDLETTSLNVFQAKVCGISFCWSKNNGWYLPIYHKNYQDGLSFQELKPYLEKIFSLSSLKIGHNLKYDIN
ncbi:MAG: DNA polymerase I, partial [Candidatus Dadabacteria bacterium]